MGLLKRLANSGNGDNDAPVAQATDLERVLRDAVEERRALQAVVTASRSCTTGLPELMASFAEMGHRATAVAQQLDSLAQRMDRLGNLTDRVQGFDQRAAALEGGVKKAEEQLHDLRSREGEIHAQREALEQLQKLARETLDATDAVKDHHTALAKLEEAFPALEAGLQPLVDQHGVLRAELGRLRLDFDDASQDAAASREAAQQARADATKATETLANLQRDLGPLGQLQTLSQDTAAQLRSLNTLAEHVGVKVKALEGQQQIVDHALVESRRVNEMVWDLDVQLTRGF